MRISPSWEIKRNLPVKLLRGSIQDVEHLWWFSIPLWKIWVSSSVGKTDNFPTESKVIKKKHMFQTTNEIWDSPSCDKFWRLSHEIRFFFAKYQLAVEKSSPKFWMTVVHQPEMLSFGRLPVARPTGVSFHYNGWYGWLRMGFPVKLMANDHHDHPEIMK